MWSPFKFLLISLLFFPGRVLAEKVSTVKTTTLADPLSFGSVLQVFTGLITVLILFGLVVYLLKRLGGVRSTQAGKLAVVDTLSIGTRERILLMKAGNKQILLGVSPGRIAPLHVFDEPIADSEQTGEDPEGVKPGFSGLLQNILAERFSNNKGSK